MSKIRITKQFTFEMAHVLRNYDGPCKNIHGHSYKLDVTVAGTPNDHENSPKYGMVMDYKDLKDIVKDNVLNNFDHALLISEKYDMPTIQQLQKDFEKTITVPYQPTTENLLLEIAAKLKKLLPPGMQLFKLKLRETATAYAEWYAEDNPEQ
ncbi:MAG: 6-carboxytetrahydropterin synthase QueD [Bacteroidales bacterium]